MLMGSCVYRAGRSLTQQMTLNFDLDFDLSEVSADIGMEAEHLCWILRKLDVSFGEITANLTN